MMEKTTPPKVPTLVKWPGANALQGRVPLELWWVTTFLEGGGRVFSAHFQVFHTGGTDVRTVAAITDLLTESCVSKTSIQRFGEVEMATNSLYLTTELGKFEEQRKDGYRVNASIEKDCAFDLTLTKTRPVMFNAGGGQFVLHGARTTQCSLGGLSVSGSLTFNGETFEVSGNGWYDRQWVDLLPQQIAPFHWFGIYLDNGHTISLWDTYARGDTGQTWATIVKPDGTHVITPAPPTWPTSGSHYVTGCGREVPRTWAISIPDALCELAVNQRCVKDSETVYLGALDIAGDYGGIAVRGHGFCDLVGPVDH